jgi:iron complex outermembrane receptor protein
VFFDHQFKFFNQKLEINPGASWANYSGDNFFYPGVDVGFIFNPNHKVLEQFQRFQDPDFYGFVLCEPD